MGSDCLFAWQLSLLVSLFFLWGAANNLNDILIRQFTKAFGLSTVHASLVQSSFYGGYFFGALPAAWFARRRGFKFSVCLGLCLFSAGALLFFPSSLDGGVYSAFLACLGLIAFGLAFLEASANPWVLVLAERRRPGSGTRALNAAQGVNPFGCIVGVFVGRWFILDAHPLSQTERDALTPGASASLQAREIAHVGQVYLAIGILVALVALAFGLTPADTAGSVGAAPSDESCESNARDEEREKLCGLARQRSCAPGQRSCAAWLGGSCARMRHKPAYWRGVGAQFVNIGAQVSLWSFGIRYAVTEAGVTEQTAADLLVGSLAAFVCGRFLAAVLMQFVSAERVLCGFALLAAAQSALAAVGGVVGTVSVVWASLWMGPLFPTIFALSLSELDPADIEVGSAGLVMAVVGGAAITPITAAVADGASLRLAFATVPTCCFGLVALFAASRGACSPSRRGEAQLLMGRSVKRTDPSPACAVDPMPHAHAPPQTAL